ncbi:FH2 domain-containing protein 1-like, partial [Physeter macrocephalus]|uniref:FH2 domain-containing protein 1-like n=1 Tax=Physeter macrocephalus TaxID=9755 RepID=A0A455B3F6_PHYMC
CPRQAPASGAPTEPGEQRHQGSSPAHRPPASESPEEAPHPTSAWPSQLPAPRPEEAASALPRVRRNGVSVLRKRNSEPMDLGPVRCPPLSPLALGTREHELVTGLARFDLQAAKGPEEPAPLAANAFSPMERASVGDESPQSPGASNGGPTPVGGGAQGGPSPAPGDGNAALDEPISAAPVSGGSSHPEHQDPGPLFHISDTTNCSLTLDCSEGADSSPEAGDPGEGGDGEGSVSSKAGETGGSQVSSNPACHPPAEAPIAASASGGSVPGKGEPGCKGGLPRDRPARGREALAPKRSPLKEASAGASRAGPARRGAGPMRTLTGWESESMRKVVPISRASRAPPAGKRPPREAPAGANPPAPLARRSPVLGPPNASPGRPSTAARPGREPPAPPRSSFRKPSAKPLRNVPRQKPEENKICRSGSQGPDSPEEPPRAPPAPSAPRGPAPVPSFARNTVASSSRCQRTDSPPVAGSPGLTRTVSQRQLKVKGGPENALPKDSGALRRAGSARAPRKGPESAEGPGDSAQAPPKGRGAGERASLRLKDACRGALGKGLHPLRK